MALRECHPVPWNPDLNIGSYVLNLPKLIAKTRFPVLEEVFSSSDPSLILASLSHWPWCEPPTFVRVITYFLHISWVISCMESWINFEVCGTVPGSFHSFVEICKCSQQLCPKFKYSGTCADANWATYRGEICVHCTSTVQITCMFFKPVQTMHKNCMSHEGFNKHVVT